MIDVYIVHNDDNIKKKIGDSNIKESPFFHFIDDRTRKGKTEAFKLKSHWAAKLTPFVIIMEGDKAVKAFYSEADNDVISSLIKYLEE